MKKDYKEEKRENRLWFEVSSIGYVRNDIREPTDPNKIKQCISELVLYPEYKEALEGIEMHKYLRIVYYFHKSSSPHSLTVRSYLGKKLGIFATRSSARPSPIGVSTIKLLSRDNNVLKVTELDAIDGTPILDIKPYVPALDEAEISKVQEHIDALMPHSFVWKWIRTRDYEKLLRSCASFHGHYCIGLALGVMMATYGILMMEEFYENEGLEDLIAIVEMNNCAVDAIQFITGCTIGNNSLIYRDFGKMALSLAKREHKNSYGKGIRIYQKTLSRKEIVGEDKEYEDLFRKVVIEKKGDKKDLQKLRVLSKSKALSLVREDPNRIFTIEEIVTPLPPYSSIEENIICSSCGELVIKSHSRKEGKDYLCLSCSSPWYYEMNGEGIKKFSNAYREERVRKGAKKR